MIIFCHFKTKLAEKECAQKLTKMKFKSDPILGPRRNEISEKEVRSFKTQGIEVNKP